jgi:hypothetical protein
MRLAVGEPVRVGAGFDDVPAEGEPVAMAAQSLGPVNDRLGQDQVVGGLGELELRPPCLSAIRQYAA